MGIVFNSGLSGTGEEGQLISGCKPHLVVVGVERDVQKLRRELVPKARVKATARGSPCCTLVYSNSVG